MCACVCAPHSAGWLAGVFREAEQQVENGPAMLQHTLSRQETSAEHSRSVSATPQQIISK